MLGSTVCWDGNSGTGANTRRRVQLGRKPPCNQTEGASHQEESAVTTAGRPGALAGSPCSSVAGFSLLEEKEHVTVGMSGKPDQE